MDFTLYDVVYNIYKYILNPAIYMLFAGSLGLFLFGGVKFMYSKMMGDSKILESHQQHMLWGIVGMFIMASAFGILAFISNSIRAVGGVVGV